MEPRRHAVYWTPPPGPLAAFGAAWLGWDPAEGAPGAPIDLPGLPRPAGEIVRAPRRYGLHATLRAPMRLADGVSPADARAAVEALAAILAPARCDGLRLAREGGFVALVPSGDPGELGALAARVVRATDPLRAPLDPAERARRRAGGLSARADALLGRWGYPHVMEAFSFHVTLTGPLDDAEGAAVEAALRPLVEPLLPRPFVIDAVSLVEEGEDGLFRVVERCRLSG